MHMEMGQDRPSLNTETPFLIRKRMQENLPSISTTENTFTECQIGGNLIFLDSSSPKIYSWWIASTTL